DRPPADQGPRRRRVLGVAAAGADGAGRRRRPDHLRDRRPRLRPDGGVRRPRAGHRDHQPGHGAGVRGGRRAGRRARGDHPRHRAGGAGLVGVDPRRRRPGRADGAGVLRPPHPRRRRPGATDPDHRLRGGADDRLPRRRPGRPGRLDGDADAADRRQHGPHRRRPRQHRLPTGAGAGRAAERRRHPRGDGQGRVVLRGGRDRRPGDGERRRGQGPQHPRSAAGHGHRVRVPRPRRPGPGRGHHGVRVAVLGAGRRTRLGPARRLRRDERAGADGARRAHGLGRPGPAAPVPGRRGGHPGEDRQGRPGGRRPPL
ncbi:MAG: hypothetical protein AVDCRST_MAG48-2084, partial [uncultured Friedmanniella sp.]